MKNTKIHLLQSKGLSLIELMIAITLGGLVVLATIGIFSSNKQTFTATESLSRVQENSRLAYELMTRDIREAGGNPCDTRGLLLANVLSDTSPWWASWDRPIFGYENGLAGISAANTDAIELKGGSQEVFSVKEHAPASATIKLNVTKHSLQTNDIAMICDFKQATLFQISSASDTSADVLHGTGGGTPGNCSIGLGFKKPRDCTSKDGTVKAFAGNSIISKFNAAQWYVADNGRGGRSLFRRVVRSVAGVNGPVAEEIAEGVQDMQLEYLVSTGDAYQAADTVADWQQVVGVRVVLSMQGNENIGTDGNQLRRTIEHKVALRNRNI
jgi:type IV pilus assembly protein PilW